jgi:hypothetical protein
LENASLQQKNQLAPPGTIPAVALPLPIPEPEYYPEGATAIMDVMVRQKSGPLQPYAGIGSQFQDSMLISGPISNGNQDALACEKPYWLTTSTQNLLAKT